MRVIFDCGASGESRVELVFHLTFIDSREELTEGDILIKKSMSTFVTMSIYDVQTDNITEISSQILSQCGSHCLSHPQESRVVPVTESTKNCFLSNHYPPGEVITIHRK